jgi:hypothetical protein
MSYIDIPSVRGIKPDIERIVDRVRYYSNDKFAFGVYAYGTCFFPEIGKRFDDEGKKVIETVGGDSIGFTVREMDDRNFVVRFSEYLFAVVLKDEFESIREQIESDVASATVDERLVGRAESPRDHLLIGLLARTRLFQDLNDRRLIETVHGELGPSAAQA